MPQPIASNVGESEMQKRFIESYGPFIQEFRNIEELKNRIFDLAIEKYNQIPRTSDGPLAHDTPEFQTRLAHIVINSLARAAFEDFGELLILAGNGLGFGATKTLRSLYERTVTAAYIGTKPSEAEIFVEQDAIDMHKLRQRLFEIAQNSKPTSPPRTFKR